MGWVTSKFPLKFIESFFPSRYCDGPLPAADEWLGGNAFLKKLTPAVPAVTFSAPIDPLVEKKALAAGASAVVSKYDAVAVLIGKARELLDEVAA
jgi:hypothetical protein